MDLAVEESEVKTVELSIRPPKTPHSSREDRTIYPMWTIISPPRAHEL